MVQIILLSGDVKIKPIPGSHQNLLENNSKVKSVPRLYINLYL